MKRPTFISVFYRAMLCGAHAVMLWQVVRPSVHLTVISVYPDHYI